LNRAPGRGFAERAGGAQRKFEVAREGLSELIETLDALGIDCKTNGGTAVIWKIRQRVKEALGRLERAPRMPGLPEVPRG
jgi:hypothetical protein